MAISNLSIVSLFALLLISTVNSLTPEEITRIETMIQNNFLRHHNVPGMSIAIVQDDEIFSRGYGFSNLEEEVTADNETLFAIGSLSKMLSSLFITKLLNDKFPNYGEGVLDVPIKQLAPNFNLVFSDRYRTEYATFRDILSHKLCITNVLSDLMGAAGAYENKSDVVYLQRYYPESCHFRNIRISYTNAMIHVAGEAAAAVHGSGTSFEDLLLPFLSQIGMNDTRVIRESDNFTEIPNMSQPYYHRDGGFRRFNIELLKRAAVIPASGGVLTTSNDMANFMSFLINNGRVGETQVVKEEVIRWITKLSTPYDFRSYKNNPNDRPVAELGYAIGLILGIYDNYQRLRHTGYHIPYTNLINVYPALKIGIFTTANGPGPRPDHEWIHTQIFEMIKGTAKNVDDNFGSEPVDADYYFPDTSILNPSLHHQEPYIVTPTKENSVRLNHSILIGEYGFPLGGHFDITNVNETTLYFSFGKWARGYLIQRSLTPTVYDGSLDTDLTHHFYAENQNPPTVVVNFVVPSIPIVTYGGQNYQFFKDLSTDKLPEIPWADSSCGPSYT